MSQQSKFDQGDWKVKEGLKALKNGQKKRQLYIVGSRYIAEIDNWASPHNNENDKPLIEEMEANARLIASAPDLCNALESCVKSISGWLVGDWDGDPEGWELVLQKAEKALEKAKGH